MDIDNTLRLTLTHRLFSAFIHVVNRGLGDYTTPIDVLLAHAVELPTVTLEALMRFKGFAATQERYRERAGECNSRVHTARRCHLTCTPHE